MNHEINKKLVERAMGGSESAFSRLVKDHYAMVFGLAFSTVKESGAAADLAQDTFLVAWEQIGRLKSPAAFSMWLRRIARNLALNWIRSQTYRRALVERQRELGGAVTTEGVEQEMGIAREERSQYIREGLDILSPKVREAMVLFYLKDQSVSEAAEGLGITEGALKLRLLHGRRRLRTHFEGAWDKELKKELIDLTPKVAGSRIASFMALGPVLPMPGSSASGSSIGLWIHQLQHGGASSIAKLVINGGVAMSTKKIATIAGITLLLSVGGYIGVSTVIDRGRSIPAATPRVDYADLLESEDSPEGEGALGGGTVSADGNDGSETESEISGDEATVAEDGATELSLASEEDERGRIEDPADYASVSGMVQDLKGNPIVGASVIISASGFDEKDLRGSGFREYGNILRDPGHLFSTISGPGGVYEVTGIEYEGIGAVRAAATGYAQPRRGSTNRVDLNAGDRLSGVDIVLVEGITLEGRVIASGSRPVADATVSMLGYTQAQSTTSMTSHITQTDEEGWFQLSFDEPSTAALHVASASAGKASFMNIQIYEGAFAELKMHDEASLSGMITWADGSPAEGVKVSLEGSWYDDSRGQQSLGRGTTTSGVVAVDGSYVIERIDPGQQYGVRLYSAASKPLIAPIEFGMIEAGSAEEWNHVIEEAIVVRGRVLGQQSGKPLSDVKVAALKDGVKLGDTVAEVGADGRYELTILGGQGEYHVYPSYWRLDPIEEGQNVGETLTLTPGEDVELDLLLGDTFTMSFQVVDVASQPIEDLMISVQDPGHSWGPAGYTDEAGRWAWSGFIAGVETNIKVHSRGKTRVNSTPLIGQPGEIVPEELLTLHEYGGIEGLALAPDGTPLANIPITISAAYGPGKVPAVTVYTDDLGEFVVLDQIPATTILINMQINSGPGDLPLPLSWTSETFDMPADRVVNLGAISFGGANQAAPKLALKE